MKRILLIYNPQSSRYSEIQQEVLPYMRSLKGFMVGKYKISPTPLNDNILNFTKLVKDGDLVIVAGGDATGIVASNAILNSNKDVTLAVLPYGNFNDFARTLGTKTINDIFKQNTAPTDDSSHDSSSTNKSSSIAYPQLKSKKSPYQNYYPLEIYVDDHFFRYATCYVTIGMTAEAVSIYNSPTLRKKLKNGFGRSVSSYSDLALWYFKNRHKKQFLPEFKLNGVLQPPKTSDYAAINSLSIARVIKGGDDYKKPKTFRHETDRLTSFFRLFKFMSKGIFHRIPGTDTTGDILEFTQPATVILQSEGEPITLQNISKIEIKKGSKCLKTITNH